MNRMSIAQRRSRRWVPLVRRRSLVLCILGISLAFALTSCAYWFMIPKIPLLTVGPLTVSSDRGEIIFSVANMPNGGLASVAVELGGLDYDVNRISNVRIEGLSGFEVAASGFENGECAFLLCNPCSGLLEGEFARLTFDVADDAILDDFTFRKRNITLGNDGYDTIAFRMVLE